MRCGAPPEPPDRWVAFRPVREIPGAKPIDVEVARPRARANKPAVNRPVGMAGLDKIDWDALKTAGGRGSRIGRALEILARTDVSADDRQWAQSALHGDPAEQCAGVALLAFARGGEVGAPQLAVLVRSDPDPMVRINALWALAILARNAGAACPSELWDAVRVEPILRPLVAAARVLRDGDRATDEDLEACATNAAFNKHMQRAFDRNRNAFMFCELAGAGTAITITTAVATAGLRGIAANERQRQRERAAWDQMMKR